MKSSWEDLIQNLVDCGILKSPQIIRAMRMIPRDLFLLPEQKSYATIDSPLPIGEGQTISAPQS